MPNLNQSQVDVTPIGVHVARATAALPQTATGHLFTVTGRVLVTALVGQVTTAIQSTDPVAKITSTPTAGTAVDVASTVDLSSLEVGGFIFAEGDGTALVKSNAGAAFIGANSGRFICNAGYIDLITGASKTGAVKWDLYYVPLDDSSSVVAA
jgi:hypothetical protein